MIIILFMIVALVFVFFSVKSCFDVDLEDYLWGNVETDPKKHFLNRLPLALFVLFMNLVFFGLFGFAYFLKCM